MNIDNIIRLHERLVEVGPEHVDMDTFLWISRGHEAEGLSGTGEISCGTTACLAGHAAALHMGMIHSHFGVLSYEKTAGEFLEITPEQGDILFYEGRWPYRFRQIVLDTNYRTGNHQAGDHAGMLALLEALVLEGEAVFAESRHQEDDE